MSTPLWAPWRMEYLARDKKLGCFLCGRPKDPGTFGEKRVLLVEPHACGCLNRYPFTTSHLMVAPRRRESAWRRLYPAFADLPGVRAPAPATP